MSKTPDEISTVPISVLIVDDDEAHAQTVAESLERMKDVNCSCTVATSGQQGASLIESENYDVVVTDLRMEEIDGLGILRKTKEELPHAEVIVLTGHGTISSAVTAMQHGAYTYLTKPLDIQELRSAVNKASSRLQLIRRNAELSRQLDERFGFEGIVGTSPQMHKIIDTLQAVAPRDISVLIEGENGTGKELVAKAIHQNSPRKNKPFVPLNVAVIPDSILESELFGHEPESFTGATQRRIGKFEYANGGTLFLDEVGEMPLETQVKLLRVLEERTITRLGANEPIPINVRLVAATNANLKQMIEEKTFREDLYHRLHVVRIEIPPLRERRGDISLLLEHFRKEMSDHHKKENAGFSRLAQQALMMYDWPGNIRELKNKIEGMVVLDTDGMLDVDDLPEQIASLTVNIKEGESPEFGTGPDWLVGRPLEEVERYYIQKALEMTEGKRKEAAEKLGIGERTLYRKINDYGLQ